jgi:dihydroorotase-like cyclic amidohydrolase
MSTVIFSAKAGGIWSASPGCPGLETLLPVLLSEGYRKRGLPLVGAQGNQRLLRQVTR